MSWWSTWAGREEGSKVRTMTTQWDPRRQTRPAYLTSTDKTRKYFGKYLWTLLINLHAEGDFTEFLAEFSLP